MTEVTKGFAVKITGELLTQMLRGGIDLPEDTFLFKIIPSPETDHCFDLLFKSEKGFEIIEGDAFPRIMGKEDLPDGDEVPF